MADLILSALIHRDSLGLEPLETNDFENYYVAATPFFGTSVQWNRQQVTSPWLDGAVTTNRTRGMVMEQCTWEVLGGDVGEMRANAEALVAACLQDDFIVEVTIEGEQFLYQCEAADYGMPWSGPRFIAAQNQVVLTIPRQPVPLNGMVL